MGETIPVPKYTLRLNGRSGDASERTPTRASCDSGLLCPVDGAALLALLVAPLQRVEDLALALGVSLRTAYRHLDRLRQRGLVDTVLPGNLGRASARLAYLTRAGQRDLARGDRVRAHRLACEWDADFKGLVHLLPRLPARVTVQQVLPELLLACRQVARGSGHVSGREPERRGALDASALRWRWALDYQHAFSYRNRRFRLHVDALLAVGAGWAIDEATRDRSDSVSASPKAQVSDSRNNRWHAIWVLLDPVLGNQRALLPRLQALIAYRESAERWGNGGAFPSVFVLTTSARRAEVWRQAAREAAARLRADPLEGVVRIAPPGSTACWPLSVPGTPLPTNMSEPASSWIDLASGIATTRDALFQAPLPRAALPLGLASAPLYPLRLGHVGHVGHLDQMDQVSDVADDGVNRIESPMSSARQRSVNPGNAGSSRAGGGNTRVRERRALQASLRVPSRHGTQHADELTLRLTRSRSGARKTTLDSDQRARLRARLALTLPRREETVLELLATHPLAAQEDLACWIGVEPIWIDRLRRQLRRAGLVQGFRIPAQAIPLPLYVLPAGSAQQMLDPNAQRVASTALTPSITYLLRLTPLAWNYLAAVYGLPVRQLVGRALSVSAAALLSAASGQASTTEFPVGAPSVPHQGAVRLPGIALHQAGVQRFFTLLKQHARARATQSVAEGLLWWETGVACVRRYRTMGLRGTLRPDAAAEYLFRGRRVHFWLEWDTGSMTGAALRQKLDRYATYADSTAWCMEVAPSLPLLLIVVPDVAQEERVTRLVEELMERARLRWPGPLLIRITTVVRLAREGPLAPIWRSLLPDTAPEADDHLESVFSARDVADPSHLIGPLDRVPPTPPRVHATNGAQRRADIAERHPSAAPEGVPAVLSGRLASRSTATNDGAGRKAGGDAR